MDMVIRDAKLEDMYKVADINIKDWKKAYKEIIDEEFLKSINIEDRTKKMEEIYNKGIIFIVAELNNQVVGYCTISNDDNFSSEYENVDCELLALYVDPEKHGLGIGRKLVEFAKVEFKKENKNKMIIWCLKDNYPSRKFYEKVGGKLDKERMIKIGNKEYPEVSFIYNL